MTTFLGLPWDFVRENAMLDHENAKKEDYMKEYWESFTKLLKEEEKYKEQDTLLQEMIKIQGEFNADEKNAAKVKV